MGLNRIEVGDKVRLRSGPDTESTAIVVSVMKDVKGGVKLDRKLNGLWCYCMGELMKVPPSPRATDE